MLRSTHAMTSSPIREVQRRTVKIPNTTGHRSKNTVGITVSAMLASSSSALHELLPIYLISLSTKLLLLPAPYSTDLEVHRHWKSLTLHKPLAEWYSDSSSTWTLDYPPLFAFFEYALSGLITRFSPGLTSLSHDGRHTDREVAILRVTVLFCEPLLLYAIYKLATLLQPPRSRLRAVVTAVALPGLTLVDNIHFQYNALPLSFFLLSIYYLSIDNLHLSTILFCTTLNLKQTFLPILPIFILKTLTAINHHSPTLANKLTKLLSITLTAIISISLPWLPFLYTATYQQALQRIFPLHRGLLHANWAPNIWSPYAALDLLFSKLLSKGSTSATTRGVINIMRPFSTLPNPTPIITTLLTIFSILPFTRLLHAPTPLKTTTVIAAAALSAFLLGWHVHEKAVLLPLLPLSLTNHEAFIWLSLGGQFALLELLRYPQIAPFLIAHFIAFHSYIFAKNRAPRAAVFYFFGCLIVEAYSGVIGGHRIIFGDRLQFFPIMLVSLYSFIGVFVAYVVLLRRALKGKND